MAAAKATVFLLHVPLGAVDLGGTFGDRAASQFTRL